MGMALQSVFVTKPRMETGNEGKGEMKEKEINIG